MLDSVTSWVCPSAVSSSFSSSSAANPFVVLTAPLTNLLLFLTHPPTEVYPGRVYNHGGGAFIVAYLVFVLVLGVPLYMHDLKVGQFFRKGAYGSFSEMSPLLAGTGLAHVLIASIMIAYFNVIIGWAAIYLYHSFFDPLPWEGDTRTFFYQEVCGASDDLGDVNR